MRNAARWDEEIDTPWLHGVIDGFGGRPEALVAIFSAVEERYGYLPERALREVSERMSIHWAQIFGAAGLGGFRLLPADGHLVTVCTCAACRFAGGEALLEALRADLGIQPGETTADGSHQPGSQRRGRGRRPLAGAADRHHGLRPAHRGAGPARGGRAPQGAGPRARSAQPVS